MKRALTAVATVAILASALALTIVKAKGESPSTMPGTAVRAEALQFLGKATQNGDAIAVRGYLNHVAGLADSTLFTSFNRGAASARFTFTSAGRINGRYVEGNTIVTTSNQTLKIAFQGRVVASLSAHFHDILNVQAANVGIATGSAWVVQNTAGSFSLGGHTYRFGRVGLPERFFTTGEGTRTQVSPPKSTFSLAGNATVIP